MNDKINPRSFMLVKFLLTLGLIFNYTISLIAFVNAINWKNKNQLMDTYIYISVETLLLISSIVCLLIFYFVRRDINKKLKHNYTKKEKYQILLIIFFLILVFTISFINLFSIMFLFINIYIFIVSLLCFQLLFGITISILESFSRLSEQSIVNRQWFENEDELKKDSKKLKVKISEKKDDFNPFMQEEKDD
ncbi:hypothetical protein [Spiroplasma diminutum]|uniref:Transmembrane protein n=1 Tax=Spiroplasma diminutum CUAS-1 TaxID=1276221 RepID=S5M1Z8_9MOLU|nr:hypothetical protein [Spiroplasma diminutum]AGR42097.1 hypothetical protein SDIMI_v3c03930 [Spiroplasma diminutum CUAS-1]